MKQIKFFIFYWVPVFIYCLLIYIQSSYPSPETIPDLPYLDKLLHFAAYAILGVLFFRAFRKQRFKDNIRLAMILSMLLSTLYGLSDELHQSYVPYRNADLMDALADMLGSVGGVYFFNYFQINYLSRGRERLGGKQQ